MIRTISLTLTVVSLAGCSLFGDSMRDRGEDYLRLTPSKEATFKDGRPLAKAGQEAYSIPEVIAGAGDELPETFEVPRPDPLIVDAKEEPSSVSLNDYNSGDLNPRIEKDGSGSRVLRLDASYAQAWIAVAEALSLSSLKVIDLNRSIGTYYLEVENPNKDQMGWWSRLWSAPEEYENQVYLLRMNRTATGVYLALLSDVDELADEALTLETLETLLKQLTTRLDQ